MYPSDYRMTNKTCPKCGGMVYSAFDVATECENIIFKNGHVWEKSPCDYHYMSG